MPKPKSTISAVQIGVFDRLDNWPGLSNIPIYDHVPQSITPESNNEFPFITIGEDSYTAPDTDTENWLEIELTVHIWSRFGGRIEAKQIQDEIRKALHRHKLDVDGANVVLCDMTSASCMRQDDGLTYHGIQDFTLILEELE